MIGSELNKLYLYLSFVLYSFLHISISLAGCLDPVWELPKGYYIQQFCRGYETRELCPTVMHYDGEQDRLSVSYMKDGYQFDITIDHVCQYVEQGFDLRVHKNISGEHSQRQTPKLWMVADGRKISKAIPFDKLSSVDEPDIVKLEKRGSPTKSCWLDFYKESGLLKGRCQVKGSEKLKKAGNEPFVMTYLHPLAQELAQMESVYLAGQKRIKGIIKEESAFREKQKSELWFYSVRSFLGVLPGVENRQEERTGIEKNLLRLGFHISEPGYEQGFALFNVKGELQLRRCHGNYSKGCMKHNMYPEMVRKHCKENNLQLVQIQKGWFCHDPQYTDKNITIAGCDIANIVVDPGPGLLVVDCKDNRGIRFMERAMVCLNHSAKFWTPKESDDLLVCHLGYTEGVLIAGEQESQEQEGLKEGDAEDEKTEAVEAVEAVEPTDSLPITHRDTEKPADDMTTEELLMEGGEPAQQASHDEF